MPIDEDADIIRAVQILEDGGIIVYPTETVYGLGCDPFSETVFNRLKGIKGREGEKPMLLLASSIDQVKQVSGMMEGTALKLAERFWPGPLTMILPPSDDLPRYLTGPGGGVAIRITSNPVASAIATGFGKPIVSTSANKAGMPPAETVDEAQSVLGDDIDCYVAGEEPLTGLPSTIVDVMSGTVKVLREGAVPVNMLEDIA